MRRVRNHLKTLYESQRLEHHQAQKGILRGNLAQENGSWAERNGDLVWTAGALVFVCLTGLAIWLDSLWLGALGCAGTVLSSNRLSYFLRTYWNRELGGSKVPSVSKKPRKRKT